MIKVFRNLRQGVFTERKFSNYLIYALGEIILVVIGILIALAINNSNQQRITRQKEQIYLQGLRIEFQISKAKLQELMAVNKQNYEGASELIQLMSDGSGTVGERQFSELLYNTFAFDIAFNPNNSLLQEMISSGSLKDISDTELRKYLTNWLSTLEDIAKQENELGVRREKVLDMLTGEAYSLRTILTETGILQSLLGEEKGNSSSGNLKLLKSTEFENNVLMFILSSHATETAHYQPLMQELDTILTLINKDIQK
jgi:hypothetical protein